tara:strand:+ start:96 stop:281 length:186 start_codon:yes stop_codon:yes gene_type:complete
LKESSSSHEEHIDEEKKCTAYIYIAENNSFSRKSINKRKYGKQGYDKNISYIFHNYLDREG